MWDTPENLNNKESSEPNSLNSLSIMGTETKEHPKTGSNDKPKQQSIGDAWLEKDGTIAMRLRNTADGMHLDATFTYNKTDSAYNDVLKHLGGLKPGEIKPVLPWTEKK
jgi:hypothetical protein